MSYRTIAVHADLSRHAGQRIRIAAALARAHDAHLVGVAASGVSREVFPHGYQAQPGSLEASYFDPLRDNAARALKRFGEIAEAEALRHDTRLVWDLASEALARQARFCDLVVVSQDDLAEASSTAVLRIPEYVAATSARPVLVVPCTPVAHTPGRDILVAWNGSKEASAAMAAALPLLRRAARVSVVSFRTADDTELNAPEHQAELSAFLTRHDVRAEVLAFERHIDCGHGLLAFAEREAYDLIVMGCYGHAQFRELFLGGVTRTVLHSATLPVLMAR